MTKPRTVIQTRIKIGCALILGAALFVFGAGCGSESATGPQRALEIISPHQSDGDRLVWDPNEEQVLFLGARATGDESSLDDLRWQQEGWQVDDREWTGRSLRVPVETPGCGYGGQEFTITAYWPDGSQAASVTVWMAKYICDGSPWLEGSGS
ncbi:MAG: hypothetical protein GF341_09290 [candidate division Zixibacteria bacterium]|nr:hypothetical protein [candidate division Zixibacteria bacterium]